VSNNDSRPPTGGEGRREGAIPSGVGPDAPVSDLLVATTNAGKVRELQALLAGLPVRLLLPAELGLQMDVEETGVTFAENATIKARAWFERTRMPTLAEDSGLEVDALGGEPGVYSARYLGLPDGPVKNERLLEILRDIPPSRRGCSYICAICLITADGAKHEFDGRCAGRIAFAPAGEGGFGFDPIMLIPRLGRTIAELPDEEKNRISHRGRATRKLVRYLKSAVRPARKINPV
jgi:XTP/dITP diphosphohydrolase